MVLAIKSGEICTALNYILPLFETGSQKAAQAGLEFWFFCLWFLRSWDFIMCHHSHLKDSNNFSYSFTWKIQWSIQYFEWIFLPMHDFLTPNGKEWFKGFQIFQSWAISWHNVNPHSLMSPTFSQSFLSTKEEVADISFPSFKFCSEPWTLPLNTQSGIFLEATDSLHSRLRIHYLSPQSSCITNNSGL